MKDLFGNEVSFDPAAPALSDAERKRQYRRNASVPRGYAAPPGTGPAGETCKSCKHYTRRKMSGTYRKCGLMEAHWTCGPKTDIKASSPACSRWEDPKQVDIEDAIAAAKPRKAKRSRSREIAPTVGARKPAAPAGTPHEADPRG